jgi:NAD(P)-dependent dehydrogenase (short-subunit alcohol dehydrogenase family)
MLRVVAVMLQQEPGGSPGKMESADNFAIYPSLRDRVVVSSEFWDKTMAVNLKHQFFLTQSLVPAMKEAGRGSIINMSSISWLIPAAGIPVYVTAKAAIVGMTRTLAHELGANGIRVNCVMPGAILTERQKTLWFTESYKAEILANQALKRLILPEEVARLVLFLAADDSAAITNQSYVIDGGWI